MAGAGGGHRHRHVHNLRGAGSLIPGREDHDSVGCQGAPLSPDRLRNGALVV
jgi:hypothetical protein